MLTRIDASLLCVGVALVAALLAVSAVLAPPARAAFPGRNGAIATVQEDGCSFTDGSCDSSPNSILSFVSPTRVKIHSTSLAGAAGLPRWSPDGRTLALSESFDSFPSPQPPPGVFLFTDADLSTRSQPAPGRRIAGTETDKDPAWSPDGLRLAVTRGTTLVTLDRDGGDRRTITAPASQPAWSARNAIAFRRGRDLYTVRPDGTSLRRLTFHGGARPSWAPSGRSLAFERNQSLYVIRADGTGRHKISSSATSPIWSPDGRYLAFLRQNPDRECVGECTPGVRLIRADGKHHSRALHPGGPGRGTGPVLTATLGDWRPRP